MKKAVDGLVSLLKWIGAFSIAGMMLLTCADVVMRAAGRPIWGAVEVAGFLATIALACALPFTHVMRGHVGVDMVVRHLPERLQAVVDLITGLLATLLFILVSWRSFLYATTLKKSGEVSMTLEFPAYVFVYFIGFAFAVLSLAILLDVIYSFKKAVGQ